ncbi:helix-turn-helix transcriptional regulator [Sphingomonas sp. H160509]|uniref:helix-turn-helix transcriptional regulator n=1 Tax=Sphingomonas sp. H160509 TaxID=2955313 RepID=UPI00406C4EC9
MLIDDDILDAVRIQTSADIRPAAEALRDAVSERTGLLVNITHNIATSTPMKDADGRVLASDVFTPGEAGALWWEVPLLGLTSPLPKACRLEGEPFWCNRSGIYSRSRNRALEALDLSDFEARAFTRAAIVAPVHLPFGQIGAASFVHHDHAVEELSTIFGAHDEALALLARIFITSYVKATEQPREQLAGGGADKAGGRVPAVGGSRQDQRRYRDHPWPEAHHHSLSYPLRRAEARCRQSRPGAVQGGAARFSRQGALTQRSAAYHWQCR